MTAAPVAGGGPAESLGSVGSVPVLGRTAVRTALVALAMLAVAFAVFAASGLVYDASTGHSGRPVWWVLVAAAVIVAALLPRVRPPVERAAGRVVFGERASGYEAVAEFMARTAATLDVDDVLPRLAETTARSLHSERSEVSVWLADGRQWRQTWPPSDDDDDDGGEGELSVEVRHHGDVVGELGVTTAGAALSAEDRRVLAELAAPAGVALATVRLTVELRRRVAETADLAERLSGVRARLIESRRREQRAVLARVHSTVTPRLAATRQALVALQDQQRRSAVSADALRGAGTAAAEALDALRGLAKGVFPALLADAGLPAALRSWADLRAAPVAVTVEGDAGALRGSPAAEAALYFAVTEVVGDDAGWTIRLRGAPDGMTVAVDAPAPGVGVAPATEQAVEDRVGALGGTWRRDGAVAGRWHAFVPAAEEVVDLR